MPEGLRTYTVLVGNDVTVTYRYVTPSRRRPYYRVVLTVRGRVEWSKSFDPTDGPEIRVLRPRGWNVFACHETAEAIVFGHRLGMLS